MQCVRSKGEPSLSWVLSLVFISQDGQDRQDGEQEIGVFYFPFLVLILSFVPILSILPILRNKYETKHPRERGLSLPPGTSHARGSERHAAALPALRYAPPAPGRASSAHYG